MCQVWIEAVAVIDCWQRGFEDARELGGGHGFDYRLRTPNGSSARWPNFSSPAGAGAISHLADVPNSSAQQAGYHDRDRRGTDVSPLNWGDLGVSGLPTGTVTLLLADVEGSTRLWETQPDVMTDAVARLDETLDDAVAKHGGVRPVEQGEGDSFVIAFARASDAVACALDLQLAPLAPIKLRIGVHTGEIRLRDEGNYIGPTINRAARLRDLGHGGQTLISGAVEPLVVDQLPADVTLADLGTHALRDLPRPERVIQLCHPDLSNDFPPLRTANAIAAHNLPAQLTSFIGRQKEIAEVRRLLTDNRLVTLTGVGGTGKTRLAAQVATELASDFADGAWYVDLAPISVPELVPTTVARALGLTDQPGQSTLATLQRFLSDRTMLMVLDNCEHLIEAAASLIGELLSGSSGLTLLTTSREPIGRIWRGDVGRAVTLPGRRGHRPVCRSCAPGPRQLPDRSRQHRGRHRDLSTPRRLAAGHRAGRRAHPRPLGDRHRRKPPRPVSAADRRSPYGGTAPTDPACIGRLVARLAVRLRANHVPAVGRLRRRVRSRRGARGHRWRHGRAVPGARPTDPAR